MPSAAAGQPPGGPFPTTPSTSSLPIYPALYGPRVLIPASVSRRSQMHTLVGKGKNLYSTYKEVWVRTAAYARFAHTKRLTESRRQWGAGVGGSVDHQEGTKCHWA